MQNIKTVKRTRNGSMIYAQQLAPGSRSLLGGGGMPSFGCTTIREVSAIAGAGWLLLQ